MTNEEMRLVIKQIILQAGGITRVDLALKTMEIVNPHRFDSDIFNEEMFKLGFEREITEIRFGYKSILLPNNVRIEITK